VVALPEPSCRMLCELVKSFAVRGCPVLFTHNTPGGALRRTMKAKLGDRFEELFRCFDDDDLALEWSEDRIIASHGGNLEPVATQPADYEICAGLSAADIAVITPLLESRTAAAGERIIGIGEAARELFIIIRGRVSARLPVEDGPSRRLATFTGGMAFGELALIDGAPRSAEITADTDVELHVLSVENFERLKDVYPQIKIAILKNLTLLICRKLRKANRELIVRDQ